MDKYRLIMLILDSLLKAAQAGRQLGIQERTTQRWWKEYCENTDTFFNSKKKIKRKTKKLHDIHKKHIVECIDDNPSTAVDQVMESLIKKFEDLDIKKSAVHKFMNEECQLTFKKAAFYSTRRLSEETINNRYEWIVHWKNTDMDYYKNCIFIDESGFNVNM
ncbi:unnamed protein product [Cunninghamella echinulata]